VDETTVDDVLRVVRGLDGLPLALELAAARLRTLSLAELAARLYPATAENGDHSPLSDRFRLLSTGNRTASPRHRTLRAVIAWSWDLLGANERTVADRISVLPGGVTQGSATAVCAGAGVPVADIPELLATLVDRSLLQLAPDAGRYRMLESLREYGMERLAEQGTLGAARDLAARHLADLVARHDPQLRGPGQLAALRVMRAEYDNALAALRHLCDSGDGAAVVLATDLSWYWQMLGRHADAAYWLGEALARPAGRPTLQRDCAEAARLLNQISAAPSMTIDGIGGLAPELRALADRLLAYPSLPGLAGVVTAVTLYFLQEEEASLAVIQRLIDGPDGWLSGLARLLRAQLAENHGDLDRVREDLVAALECFYAIGDRWGLATALPMRALLRQYDGDLDGALADLREARARARDFGSLSLSDEIFIDLRWIDLHMRRGEDAHAVAMLDEARERTRRSATPELIILVDAVGAGLWMRIGDLDRAQELVELAEAGMDGAAPFGGDHGQALVSAVRAALCVKRGDAAGAEVALARAYAAAVQSRDMPILSMVTVTAAGLGELYGRHEDVALMLGAAARLRGAHDRSDPQIRAMLERSRAALGEAVFAEAYQTGWQWEAKTASARVDPARLRRELPGPLQARRA
jgi:predicted ATPase